MISTGFNSGALAGSGTSVLESMQTRGGWSLFE